MVFNPATQAEEKTKLLNEVRDQVQLHENEVLGPFMESKQFTLR